MSLDKALVRISLFANDAADTTDDGAGGSMWQNQQNESTQRADSDQPGRPPRLIRVFAEHSVANEASKFISP